MITTDPIELKKELLTEQLYNFQHSGHFTEKEIDRLCAPIKLELEQLACCEAHNLLIHTSGDRVNSFEELKNQFLKMIKNRRPNDFEVIDAEILTPNNKQA